MIPKEILQHAKADFDGALDFYTKDIATIRTGRATPALVEDIVVEYYGQRSHIKELASLSVPEPRTLAIQPWDKAAVEPIYTAIKNSDLAVSPVVDGQIIRITIPALTEERRKEFVKILKKKTEEARIRIRQARETSINETKKHENLSDDEQFKAKDDLQKMVEEYNKKIEALEIKKESDLLS